jgi:hypothetical protein
MLSAFSLSVVLNAPFAARACAPEGDAFGISGWSVKLPLCGAAEPVQSPTS